MRDAKSFTPGVGFALPYPTLSVEEIAALPVRELADDAAHLYLWTVNRHLAAAFGVARAWGFRFSTMLTWVKTPRGVLCGAYSNTTEHCLFCRRGVLTAKRRVDTTWWHWPRGEHSAKPEAFLDMVEQVSPGPYLELFARRQRLGWDTWGNEALEHVTLATAPPSPTTATRPPSPTTTATGLTAPFSPCKLGASP